MFATANRTTRFAGFTFALLMTVAVHGAMLTTFDRVATDAFVAQSIQTGNVAVLDRVTIVAHRT